MVALAFGALLAPSTGGCWDTGPECDADGDGYRNPACGGDDCDDANAAVHPGADDPEDLEWALEAVPFANKRTRGSLVVGPDDRPYFLFETWAEDDEPVWPPFETDTFLLRRSDDGWEPFDQWDGEMMSADVPEPGSLALAADRLYLMLGRSGLASTSLAQANWTMHGLPEGWGAGESLAVSPDGSLVAYDGPRRFAVYYSVPSDSWSIEPFDGEENASGVSSALGADNSFRVCFWRPWPDWVGADVILATRTPEGDWSLETIDSVEGPNSGLCDVAVGPDGTTRVAMTPIYGALWNQLRVATQEGDGWRVDTVAEEVKVTGRFGGWLAVDSSGRAQLAFAEGHGCDDATCGSVDVVHAVERAEGWDVETVAVGSWDHFTEPTQLLAVDSRGRAMIVFEPGGDSTAVQFARQVDRVDEACDGPR